MQHRHIARRFWAQSGGLSLDTQALKLYDDIIDLSVGDTDFITDERVIAAAFKDAASGHTRYGDPQGDPELIEAVCGMYMEDFGLAISPKNVLVTASSCMGMGLAMLATLNPGDEVIIFGPYFPVYKGQVELAGGVAVEVQTHMEDGYAIHAGALEAAITPRTRAIVFNTPNNPTGAAYGPDTLQLIADAAQRHDLVVMADEIYTAYDFATEFIPMRSLPGMAGRTITLNSFSKNYMMTGWRIGYIVAEPHFVQAIMRINNNLVYTSPAPSQRAALHAIPLRKEIRERCVLEYGRRINYAAERIASLPFMEAMRPGGTFYIFPSIKRTGLSSSEFCSLLLHEAHILASAGSAFGAAGEGHLRLACTVPIPMLEQAFDRMEKLPAGGR